MKKIGALVIVVILLLFPQISCGATIHGKTYEFSTLEPMKDVRVEVYLNSTLIQREVAENGEYSFDLSPGDYLIKAKYFRGSLLDYYADENVTVIGDTVLDLIMMPNLDIDEALFPPNITVPEIRESGADPNLFLLVIPVAAVIVISVLFLKRRKKGGKEKLPLPASPAQVQELPDDLKSVVGIIKDAGGRITQKELRKKLPYSEAKVSLMVADLENRGVLRKIKKGRGNIIILDRIK
jgi:uncharacterized membrane protein